VRKAQVVGGLAGALTTVVLLAPSILSDNPEDFGRLAALGIAAVPAACVCRLLGVNLQFLNERGGPSVAASWLMLGTNSLLFLLAGTGMGWLLERVRGR